MYVITLRRVTSPIIKMIIFIFKVVFILGSSSLLGHHYFGDHLILWGHHLFEVIFILKVFPILVYTIPDPYLYHSWSCVYHSWSLFIPLLIMCIPFLIAIKTLKFNNVNYLYLRYSINHSSIIQSLNCKSLSGENKTPQKAEKAALSLNSKFTV